MIDCYNPQKCEGISCIKCNTDNPGKATITKEMMVCPCGNSKNEIYAEMIGLKVTKWFIKCPKCKKESLIGHIA